MNLVDKNALDENSLKTGDESSDEDKKEKINQLYSIKLVKEIFQMVKKESSRFTWRCPQENKMSPQLIKDDPDADDLLAEGEESKDNLVVKVPVDDYLQRRVK